MAARRTAKRTTTKKASARGAKKKVVAKKAVPRKAAKKPAAKSTKKAAPAKKAKVAQPPRAKPNGSPKSSSNFPRFVWLDLMTNDPVGARSFYTSVLGWTARDEGIPGQGGGTYTMLGFNGKDFGGIAALPDPNQAPSWTPYVLVDNVEKVTKDAARRGATIAMPPQEIPTVGKFSFILDPTKAMFSPMSFHRPPAAPGPKNLFGPVAWNDLWCDEPQRGFDFYGGLFDWASHSVTDPILGLFYEFTHQERGVGGLIPRLPFLTRNFWMPYFEVGDCNAHHQKAINSGGKEIVPPTDIVHFGKASVLTDPQGAVFALMHWA